MTNDKDFEKTFQKIFFSDSQAILNNEKQGEKINSKPTVLSPAPTLFQPFPCASAKKSPRGISKDFGGEMVQFSGALRAPEFSPPRYTTINFNMGFFSPMYTTTGFFRFPWILGSDLVLVSGPPGPEN